MGGRITVGIKRPDGREFVHERWTNPLPYYFSNPDFLLGKEEAIQQYELAPEELHKNYIIYPYDYGIVLVDFPRKMIFSRQRYTTLGQVVLFDDDKEMYENIFRLYELNLIGDVIQTMDHLESWYQIKLLDKEINQWIAKFKKYFAGEEIELDQIKYSNYIVKINAGYKIDHQDKTRFDINWDDTIKFIKEGNWKTPIETSSNVTRMLKMNQI